MPVHDWTRVSAGTFHDFHLLWCTELKRAIMRVLPDSYEVLLEQHGGGIGAPDLLTLQTTNDEPADLDNCPGVAIVTETQPQTQTRKYLTFDHSTPRQRNLVVRTTNDERIVAMVEIVSEGNKSSRHALASFLDKAVAALNAEIHMLLIDIHPPTTRDPNGIHGALVSAIQAEPYELDPQHPLLSAAYRCDDPMEAFVESFAVGDLLPTMPLFLTPRHYLRIPLEETYMNAWRDISPRTQARLTAPTE